VSPFIFYRIVPLPLLQSRCTAAAAAAADVSVYESSSERFLIDDELTKQIETVTAK
jgi:hypothetical protein